MDYVTIRVAGETLALLRSERLQPYETFDQVIRRMIEKEDRDCELSPEELRGVEEGLADARAGRVYTTEQLERELGI